MLRFTCESFVIPYLWAPVVGIIVTILYFPSTKSSRLTAKLFMGTAMSGASYYGMYKLFLERRVRV